MTDRKHNRYQDYVISEGKLVGEFEEMYRDFSDPWEQSVRETGRREKEIAADFLRKAGIKKICELGCGLGFYTDKLRQSGMEALGVDISETAISKARDRFPECQFMVGDILDFDIYRTFQPGAIIMAEITWYILDKLESFLKFFRDELRGVYLIHLLTTYPVGVQQYGREKFTDLQGILKYFNLNFIEYGEIGYSDFDGERRTYFIGT